MRLYYDNYKIRRGFRESSEYGKENKQTKNEMHCTVLIFLHNKVLFKTIKHCITLTMIFFFLFYMIYLFLVN